MLRTGLIAFSFMAAVLAQQDPYAEVRHLSEAGLRMLMALEGTCVKQGQHTLHGGSAPHVGYGHRIRTGEVTWFQGGLSESGAQALLRADVERAEATVRELVRVPLKQHEFDALVMLAFNVGLEGLRGRKLIACLNAGERKSAMESWANFVKSRNPVTNELEDNASLLHRRRDEVYLFRTGRYIQLPPRNKANEGKR
jgi:GH24 family phage-related lysozyme (muramidase)